MIEGLLAFITIIVIIIILTIVLEELKRNKEFPTVETKWIWHKYIYAFTFSIVTGFSIYFILESQFFKHILSFIIPTDFLNMHMKYFKTIGASIILTLGFIIIALLREILQYALNEKIDSSGWDNLIGFAVGKVIVIIILLILIFTTKLSI